MRQRKRPSYAAIAAARRAGVADAEARFGSAAKYSPEWHDAYRLLTGAQQELKVAEAKLRERRERDARRKVRDRADGRVKPRLPRPTRTIEQDVERLRKSVATRRAKLAAMESGSDAWHRAVKGLQITESELERMERLALF